MAISLGAAVAFVCFLVFLHVPLEILAAVVKPIHPGAGAFVAEAAGDVRRVHARARLVIAGWSFVYLALVMTSFVVVARAWSDPAPLRALLIGIPVAIILSTIPITIGGLGLRESLFVAILGKLDVSGAEALFLALFWGRVAPARPSWCARPGRDARFTSPALIPGLILLRCRSLGDPLLERPDALFAGAGARGRTVGRDLPAPQPGALVFAEDPQPRAFHERSVDRLERPRLRAISICRKSRTRMSRARGTERVHDRKSNVSP